MCLLNFKFRSTKFYEQTKYTIAHRAVQLMRVDSIFDFSMNTRKNKLFVYT